MKRKEVKCSDCGGKPKIITEDSPHIIACSDCGKETIAWARPMEAWRQWKEDNYNNGYSR